MTFSLGSNTNVVNPVAGVSKGKVRDPFGVISPGYGWSATQPRSIFTNRL